MKEFPALSSRQKLERSLTQLGFGHDTRGLSVLRAIIKIQSTPSRSLAISEIHDSLKRVEPGTSLSNAWVRKVLEQLSDMQMIRKENESEPRRKYIGDINTIVAGLEQLKGRTLSALEKRTETLGEQLSRLAAIDIDDVARAITGELAVEPARPSSRLLKGLQSYREFADAEIYSRARQGDIIRISQTQLKPFRETAVERATQAINAAENGADVRGLISPDLLGADDILAGSFPKATLVDVFVKAFDVRQRGLKLDFRIFAGRGSTYHFSSLNSESMVILISEDPMAAMGVRRNFNPDLIQAAISSFERTWQGLTPLLEDPKHPEIGVPRTDPSFFLTALRKAATRVTSGGT
jgi:hypothetical protein